MERPILTAALLAALACSSALPGPGPGVPADVRSIRLYDGAGVERTDHIFIFRDDTLHLQVRLFADDGRYLTEVAGGLEMTLTFTPPSIASSTAVPDVPLIRAVTTTAAANTPGTVVVTLRFLSDGSEKTFGPFECLVH